MKHVLEASLLSLTFLAGVASAGSAQDLDDAAIAALCLGATSS